MFRLGHRLILDMFRDLAALSQPKERLTSAPAVTFS